MEIIEREVKMLTFNNGKCPFEEWYRGIKDGPTRARVRARLARLEVGNFGDYKPLDGGVMELRLDFGPGYRVYLAQSGSVVIVLLAGGDKSTQERDIGRALDFWQEYENDTERFQRDFGG